MKKVYVPAGEVVTYHSLHTDKVIVKGCLRVSGKLVAKEILGGGIVEAREVICDDIRLSSLTSDFVTARSIAADKLFVQFNCTASGQIAVRDYLTARYVNTGRLSVSLSEICTCDADEVITVRQRRSMLSLLWASWWRGLFLDLFHGGGQHRKTKEPVRDADSKDSDQQEQKRKEESAAPQPAGVLGLNPEDDTVATVLSALTCLKENGYRITKEKPAENDGDMVA